MKLYKHKVNFYFFNFGRLNYYRIAEEIVQWWNDCYDINTNRLFYCGNIRQNIKSHPENGSGELPPGNFDFHVYIVPQSSMPSHTAGLTLFREDGAGVIVLGANTPTLSLYPLPLSFKNASLHESGHCFGMAIGEFYKIRNIVDLTLVQPELKVSISKMDDYWSSPLRCEWKKDVMLNLNAAEPKWCVLDALVAKYGIWRAYGPPCPNLESIPVATPHPRCEVLVYQMSYAGYGRLGSYVTGDDGKFVLDWGCNSWEAISNDQLRKLVFLTPDGAKGCGLSIFDIQESYLLTRERENSILNTSSNIGYCVRT